jgi:hypothetical protein
MSRAAKKKKKKKKKKYLFCLVKGILALEHPTIALSVKTRQAIRIVLNVQHDTVKQLRMEGALQETDANLLKKVSECAGIAYVIACGVFVYFTLSLTYKSP